MKLYPVDHNTMDGVGALCGVWGRDQPPDVINVDDMKAMLSGRLHDVFIYDVFTAIITIGTHDRMVGQLQDYSNYRVHALCIINEFRDNAYPKLMADIMRRYSEYAGMTYIICKWTKNGDTYDFLPYRRHISGLPRSIIRGAIIATTPVTALYRRGGQWEKTRISAVGLYELGLTGIICMRTCGNVYTYIIYDATTHQSEYEDRYEYISRKESAHSARRISAIVDRVLGQNPSAIYVVSGNEGVLFDHFNPLHIARLQELIPLDQITMALYEPANDSDLTYDDDI